MTRIQKQQELTRWYEYWLKALASDKTSTLKKVTHAVQYLPKIRDKCKDEATHTCNLVSGMILASKRILKTRGI